MKHRRQLAIAVLLLPLAAGCGLDYYFGLAAGALGSFARTRPIEQALADPNLSEELKSKLRFVQEVRQFGIDEIGLNAGQAFTLFDDDRAVTNGIGVGWSVSATRKDRFEAYVWYYPFIGAAEYRGFFSEDAAEREAASLEAQGYDAYIGIIGAFSTLGLLPDPIRASTLNNDEISLAELVLHELVHSTYYKPGDTTYNETGAQFVGRNAARLFYQTRRPPAAAETVAALARYDDEDVIDEFVGAVHEHLAAYYAMPLTHDEILAGRQAEFEAVAGRYTTDYRPRLNDPDRYVNIADLELNNAFIDAAARYRGDLPVYQSVLDRLGGDVAAALLVFRDAAGQPDSFSALEAWLAANP